MSVSINHQLEKKMKTTIKLALALAALSIAPALAHEHHELLPRLVRVLVLDFCGAVRLDGCGEFENARLQSGGCGLPSPWVLQ